MVIFTKCSNYSDEHRTVRFSFKASKEAREVHNPFSAKGLSSPNGSDFELPSVNVKHFHFLQSGRRSVSVTPSTFRQKFPLNPTYKGNFPLFNHLPPAQLAPSPNPAWPCIFVFLFSLKYHCKKLNPNTHPGYKKLISTEFIQPLIQEVEEKRQQVMPCVVKAEIVSEENIFKST